LRAMYSSYEAVCEALDRRRGVALGFERIEALLRTLGDPHRSLRVVQVVGTNGKGTTAIALANALEAAGQPSGAYLSPHVLSYNERVMFRASFASNGQFAAAMGKAIEAADANGIPATQFELLTAGAIATFRDAGLTWAVLEAGLGARHDATSAAEPEAVVLTNVGFDHTEYLGNTLEEIAKEKLASLRPGAVLILGTKEPLVREIARREAARVGARLVEHDETEKPYHEAQEPTYLAHNERLGVRAAEVLLGRPLWRDEREAARALTRAVRLPARFEVHEVRGVPVIVDGGHNPEGLAAVLEAIRGRFGGLPLGVVFGALKDKDVGSMLDTLESEAHALVLTRPACPTDGRALEPERAEEEYGPRDAQGRRAWLASNAGVALRLAVREMETTGGVVLVTGSLYTGAGVLGWLRGR
jgi:dihydrofolate synthase / folylpolyglutamate synthase